MRKLSISSAAFVLASAIASTISFGQTATIESSAQQDRIAARATVVPEALGISARDSVGRAAKVLDRTGRNLELNYHDDGRVRSIRRRADRTYLNDVVELSYGRSGEVTGVVLGDGNVILVSYPESGVQTFQDRYGALWTRRTTNQGIVETIALDDPSGHLVDTIQRLDAFLGALGRLPASR